MSDLLDEMLAHWETKLAALQQETLVLAKALEHHLHTGEFTIKGTTCRVAWKYPSAYTLGGLRQYFQDRDIYVEVEGEPGSLVFIFRDNRP